jgi:phosphoglycolate phosphatase-like HAD superfamily hydrolase
MEVMAASDFSAVRALIFDLDGTLIDSKQDFIRSVNAMLVEMRRETLHEDTISGYIGHGAHARGALVLTVSTDAQERYRAYMFTSSWRTDGPLIAPCVE